jgi:hypothetical protein
MIIRQYGWRGIPDVWLQPEIVWGPIFNSLDMSKEIVISVKSDSERGNLSISFNPNYIPPQQKSVIPPDQARISTEDRPAQLSSLDFDYADRDGRTIQKSHLFTTPQGEHILHIDSVSSHPRTAIYFPSREHSGMTQTADYFSRVAEMGREREVVGPLSILDPRLEILKVIAIGGRPQVHGQLKGFGKTLPINLMGEGFEKLLAIFAAIVSGNFHYVFVDEIENGLHHSAMVDIWQSLRMAVGKYDCQLFATTHSYECLQAAHEALSDIRNDFRYIRLDRQDGNISAKVADYDMIGSAIRSRMEVR